MGFLLAEVDKPSDCYSIWKVVDEGHVVDQVVCFSNAKDEYRCDALWENGDGQLIPLLLPSLE